jgi:hypothetical protein
MTVSPIKRVYLLAILVVLAGAGSFPLLAAGPDVVIPETGKPVIPDLIRRILEDPHKGYSNVKGSFDCASEDLYLRSRDILGKYAEAPVENQEALSNYLLSSKEQCKNFEILLYDLGPETSKFRSCGSMHSAP